MIIPFKDEEKNSGYPVITIVIISLCLIVFTIKQFFISIPVENFYKIFGTIPNDIITFTNSIERPFHPLLTIITTQFIHGDIFHLLGNLLFMWIFGKRIETTYGKPLFVIFFLLLSISSAYTGALANYFDLLPRFIIKGKYIPSIGLSGVVSGYMGAYLVKYPKAIIDILFIFIIVRIRAYWFLIFWIFTQIMSVIPMGALTENNTGWFAHIGGFFTGVILTVIIQLLIKYFKTDIKDNK